MTDEFISVRKTQVLEWHQRLTAAQEHSAVCPLWSTPEAERVVVRRADLAYVLDDDSPASEFGDAAHARLREALNPPPTEEPI